MDAVEAYEEESDTFMPVKYLIQGRVGFDMAVNLRVSLIVHFSLVHPFEASLARNEIQAGHIN